MSSYNHGPNKFLFLLKKLPDLEDPITYEIFICNFSHDFKMILFILRKAILFYCQNVQYSDLM